MLHIFLIRLFAYYIKLFIPWNYVYLFNSNDIISKLFYLNNAVLFIFIKKPKKNLKKFSFENIAFTDSLNN